MKSLSYFKSKERYKSVLLFLIISSFVFSFCTQEAQLWKLKSEEQVAGDYIANNPDYSEFSKLIEMTGLSALLNVRGPFTIFVPTNEAMQAYYKLKNVNSLEDFDQATLLKLIRNHIVNNEITTGDIGLGALRDTNAIGDYLVTEFEGSEILVNKTSQIVKRDIKTANGYIHIINKVMDPVTKDVYNTISADPSFKIFSEGLSLTGLKDTLQIISFPYGKKTARTRYTLFAVADTTFNRYGINNVDDLINWCGTSKSDNLKLIENPFYRFMEYHCLNGNYFLSDFTSGIYSILSHDNNISMTIAEDYKINFNSKTKAYTGFNVFSSNIPAKNGAIHTINDILPVTDPEPAIITFETTDYFDLQQEDCIGKYYKKWGGDVGLTQFEKIKYEGDYLLYYYKPNHGRTAILNNDNLSMLGFWWIEITTPKIMKGHYTVSANIWTGGDDLPIFDAYIDGVKVGNYNARLSNTQMNFGEVNWTKTEEHKVKLVCTGWGVVFWDTVVFTPAK